MAKLISWCKSDLEDQLDLLRIRVKRAAETVYCKHYLPTVHVKKMDTSTLHQYDCWTWTFICCHNSLHSILVSGSPQIFGTWLQGLAPIQMQCIWEFLQNEITQNVSLDIYKLMLLSAGRYLLSVPSKTVPHHRFRHKNDSVRFGERSWFGFKEVLS